MIRRLVQDGTVEPNDVLVALLDFGRVGVTVVFVDVVQCEVAVRDRVLAIASGPRLVNVRRRQSRREGQERNDEDEARRVSGSNHTRSR